MKLMCFAFLISFLVEIQSWPCFLLGKSSVWAVSQWQAKVYDVTIGDHAAYTFNYFDTDPKKGKHTHKAQINSANLLKERAKEALIQIYKLNYVPFNVPHSIYFINRAFAKRQHCVRTHWWTRVHMRQFRPKWWWRGKRSKFPLHSISNRLCNRIGILAEDIGSLRYSLRSLWNRLNVYWLHLSTSLGVRIHCDVFLNGWVSSRYYRLALMSSTISLTPLSPSMGALCVSSAGPTFFTLPQIFHLIAKWIVPICICFFLWFALNVFCFVFPYIMRLFAFTFYCQVQNIARIAVPVIIFNFVLKLFSIFGLNGNTKRSVCFWWWAQCI